MKKWAFKNPVIASVIISLLYLMVARGMIFANSFNIINNGVVVMIAALFVFLGMMIRETIQNAKEITNTKKYIIWGVFTATIISTVVYSFGSV